MAHTPIKFTLRPEIRDWKIFASGAKAAGFNFYFINESPPSEEANSAKGYEYTRHILDLQVPDYLSTAIKTKQSFVLQNENMSLHFYVDEKGYHQVKLSSNSMNASELNRMIDKVFKNLIQQYSYVKTLSFLTGKDYMVVGESLLPNQIVRLTIRRWTLIGRQVEEITVLNGPQKEVIKIEISPRGLVTFDLIQLQEEDRERYYRMLMDEIGVRAERRFFPHSDSHDTIKPSIADSATVRGQ